MDKMARLQTTPAVLRVSPAESEHELAPPAERDKRNTLWIISSCGEDPIRLGHILGGSNWNVRGVRTCREATVLLPENPPPVVICERDLPDGNWKDILEALTLLAPPPSLIVASRLADEYLWVEVLHLGGCDVLAKPFDEEEVLWAVTSAGRRWDYHREQTRRAEKAIA